MQKCSTLWSCKKVHHEGLFTTHIKKNAFKNMKKCNALWSTKNVHHEGLLSAHILKENIFKNHANAVHFGLEKFPLQRTL